MIRKRYILHTTSRPPRESFTVRSTLARHGSRYASEPEEDPGDQEAVTEFRVVTAANSPETPTVLEATPLTGRTHQIRVHAAESGCPILGDLRYGGAPAARVHLHALSLTLRHPATGEETTFQTPASFCTAPADALRGAIIDLNTTNAFRWRHGTADDPAVPPWYVDRLGDHLLVTSAEATPRDTNRIADWLDTLRLAGAYHKTLRRQTRGLSPEQLSPRLVTGSPAPDRFLVRENGLVFELGLAEGYSAGLFLDQRDNRRRLLVNHVAAGFPVFAGRPEGATMLNLFAYTCGFSVAAARLGARVTSVDLSKRYLAWGERNFQLNGLDPACHEFLAGDALDQVRRWTRQQRRFDAVLIDPPTYSTSKVTGRFRAEYDLPALAANALGVLSPGGVLFVSCNTARLPAERFVTLLSSAVSAAGRRVRRHHYCPQPPDFPIALAEPAHLKSLWLQVQ